MNKNIKGSVLICLSVLIWLAGSILLPNMIFMHDPSSEQFARVAMIVISLISALGVGLGVYILFKKKVN